MTQPITGSCHCGKIKYSINGEKLFEFICHCKECQKLNTGGHLCGIMYAKDSLEVSGTPSQYSYPGGSGKPVENQFCPNCGTTVFAFPQSHSEGVVVRVNTLDNPNDFKPQQSLFAESAFAWDTAIIK